MSVIVSLNSSNRRAIEIVETEAKAVSAEGQDACNLEAPIDSVDQVPKVNIRHIMSASSSLNDNQSLVRLKALHTNPKVILLSMIILKDRLSEQQKLEPVRKFELKCSSTKITAIFVNQQESIPSQNQDLEILSICWRIQA